MSIDRSRCYVYTTRVISGKFRIYPNKQQTQVLEQTIEICRTLYNESLDERRKDKGLKYYEQQGNLTIKRKITPILQSIHTQVLQDVLRRLDKAYKNYHSTTHWRLPKFKRHHKYNSITYPQQPSFQVIGNKLRLAFVGLVKIKIHRNLRGNPKTCTIIRDVDRWFACFSYNNNREKIANGRTVGIDVGIKNWITLSSGEMVDRPRFYDSAVGNIKKLQRNLSRKKKGSKNRKKARIRFAKAWRKVRLQREDYCHKITSDLSKRFQTMVFERLDIQEMVESSVACHKRQLTKNILDASWYKLKQLAAYKAEIVLINPADTTQKCSRCGFISEEKITLDVRTYECKNCGLVLDRDYNAAINILNTGQELTYVEESPVFVSTRKQTSDSNETRSPHPLGVGSSPKVRKK